MRVRKRDRVSGMASEWTQAHVFFSWFSYKNVTNYTVRSRRFLFVQNNNVYMCDLLYACIRNTSCSACQINENQPKEHFFVHSFNHFKFCDCMRWNNRFDGNAYYDEENTHNIQNTKYMKIGFHIFFLWLLFLVWTVLTLALMLPRIFRPQSASHI